MRAYAEPLDRLHEALRWFVAVPELLLLHVTTGPELRMSAISAMLEAQRQPGNTAAVFALATPAENGAEDWSARSEELAESFAVLAEEAAKAKPPLTLRAPGKGSATGFESFVRALAMSVDAVVPAFQSVILVFSPEGITDASAWQFDLRRLISDPRLKKVRYILLESEPAPGLALSTELGGLSERVDIRVDPSASREMLRAMVAGMRTAPRDADGYRLAGMAGPKCAPPQRRGKSRPPEAEAAAQLSAAGVNPALASDAMQALRVEALSASLALQDGRPQEAVQFQVKARDLAQQAGLAREATLMDLMLGSYLLQGGAVRPALEVFQRVAQRAHELALLDLEAQAQMAAGGALLMLQRAFEAADVYTRGAQVAEAQGSKTIAIECYRMVGQILLGQGRETEAATAWNRALVVANAAPVEERVLSSAPLAAKDLAMVYRRHGMYAQAGALDAQIASWQANATAASVTVAEESHK